MDCFKTRVQMTDKDCHKNPNVQMTFYEFYFSFKFKH